MLLRKIASMQVEFCAVRKLLSAVLLRPHRPTSLMPSRTFLPSRTHQYLCRSLYHQLYCYGFAANKYTRIHRGASVVNCLHNTSTNLFSTKANDVLSFDSNESELMQYLDHLLDEYNVATQKLSSVEEKTDEEIHKLNKTINELGLLVARFEKIKEKRTELHELSAIIADVSQSGQEMVEMAQLELKKVKEELEELEQEILMMLVPYGRADEHDIIIEVSAGVGGKEAMLFTNEIFNMYNNYAVLKGWTFDVIEHDPSDMGGLRKASAIVSGQEVYRHLKFEVGVHRVQRVPQTERSGRMHTSTMTVAVLPQPSEIDVQINPKDLRIDTFRASGSGGQHVNKTDSAVRIVHIPSGMVTECQQERSQFKNRATALKILRSKLYQKELTEQETATKMKRKLQVGTGARSDKIRTYNFNQDRVTDHRIGCNMHNLETFLVGGEELDEMIDRLLTESQREELLELLLEYKDSIKSPKAASKSG